jgi:hypothetical protein
MVLFTGEEWYCLSNWVRRQTSLIQNLAIGRERTRSHGWIAHINSRYCYAFGYDGAGIETELLGEEGMAKSFSDSEGQLRRAVAQTEGNLKRLKQQVDTVKATEHVQNAQAAVAARHSGAGSSMRSAVDSLKRL